MRLEPVQAMYFPHEEARNYHLYKADAVDMVLMAPTTTHACGGVGVLRWHLLQDLAAKALCYRALACWAPLTWLAVAGSI